MVYLGFCSIGGIGGCVVTTCTCELSVPERKGEGGGGGGGGNLQSFGIKLDVHHTL